MSISVRRLAALLTIVASVVGSAMTAPSAMAISEDYCGYGRAAGEPFCFEGSGFRGWRYHQASTGSGGPLVNLCVRAYGSHGHYRVHNCAGDATPANFVSGQYCDAEPTTNSSVGWWGSGTVVIAGHADSRTCGLFAANSAALPEYVADAFRDPTVAGKAGVSPDTARAVASGGGSQVFTLSGDQQRCVAAVDAQGWASACSTMDALEAGDGQQLVTRLLHDGRHQVFGTLGNVARAEVITPDGDRHALPVSGAGATVATLPSRPVAISVTDLTGASRTSGLRYDRHHLVLLAAMRHRLGNAELALDVTAEIFAKALESCDSFSSRGEGSAKAWLYAIARNQLIDLHRSGRSEDRVRKALAMQPLVVTDEQFDQLEQRLAAESAGALQALAELSGDERDAVTARVVDEAEYAEIASQLAVSESVVRKRVSRGLTRMRATLEKMS
jgi:RNA polymerase sigma factor (sigma-70 family)